MALLNIIIPTMAGRESTLSRLLHTLEPQMDTLVEVTIIRGPSGLGDKINRGYRCTGRPGNENDEWVAIIDDDDLVASDFADIVLGALGYGQDYIGYPVLCTNEGRYWMTNHTRYISEPAWHTDQRGVSPKCFLRRSIGQQVPFGNDYTADMRWGAAVTKLVCTHAYIERPLYHYDWWPHEFAVGEGRDVGTWPYDPSKFTWIEET